MRPAVAILTLVGLGALWGLGAPFGRFARLEGVETLQIVFWQACIGVVVMSAIQAWRGRLALPIERASLLLYLAVGLLGIVLPHMAGYMALGHIPAGVHALLTSLVPMFALALALGLRVERFEALRAIGLVLGAVAVAILIVPQSSLPASVPVGFVLLSALAPFCYALESAYVAHYSTAKAGAMQALLGGSIVAVLTLAPIVLISGTPVMPAQLGLAHAAIFVAGIAGTLAYAGYVALLRSAGSVFATQVAYLVTGWAMVFSILLLGERHSVMVWLAMAVLFAGLFLVQPRPKLAAAASP